MARWPGGRGWDSREGHGVRSAAVSSGMGWDWRNKRERFMARLRRFVGATATILRALALLLAVFSRA